MTPKPGHHAGLFVEWPNLKSRVAYFVQYQRALARFPSTVT
jgi:hypothetical protein